MSHNRVKRLWWSDLPHLGTYEGNRWAGNVKQRIHADNDATPILDQICGRPGTYWLQHKNFPKAAMRLAESVN